MARGDLRARGGPALGGRLPPVITLFFRLPPPRCVSVFAKCCECCEVLRSAASWRVCVSVFQCCEAVRVGELASSGCSDLLEINLFR